MPSEETTPMPLLLGYIGLINVVSLSPILALVVRVSAYIRQINQNMSSTAVKYDKFSFAQVLNAFLI